MHVVEERLLEVVGMAMQRPLTKEEARDLCESCRYIVNREVRHGNVLEKLNLASRTHDWAWMQELTPEYRRVLNMY